jgi:hypothetical protein
MAYHFEKLYADLVTPDGAVYLLYLATLDLLGTKYRYAGLECYSASGERQVIAATPGDDHAPDHGAGTELRGTLATASGELRYEFQPLVGGLMPDRPACDGLRWSVRLARAAARLKLPAELGGGEVQGTGYVDHVALDRITRRFGLRRVDWGRAHLRDATVVWNSVQFCDGRHWDRTLRWQRPGGSPQTLERGAFKGPPDPHTEIARAGGLLDSERVLHHGTAIDRQRFPNAAGRWAVRALTGWTEERRCVSRIAQGDHAPGWGVYETVHFDKCA